MSKTASPALIAFLGTKKPFFTADLYTITPVGGSPFRCTTFDRAIQYSGQIFRVARFGVGNNVPSFSRSKVRMAVGLVASKVDVQVQAGPDALIAGQPILQAIANGDLANAAVSIRRAFMTYADVHFNDGAPAAALGWPAGVAVCNLTGEPVTGDGTLLWFAGNIGEVQSVQTILATFEVRDLIYDLNRTTPKNLLGPGCWHQLFDLGCTLSPSGSFGGNPFSATGTVAAGSTTQVIQTSLTNSSGPAAPVSAPTLTDFGNTGVPLAAGTYFSVVTYLNALGETLPSPEGIIALAPNHVPVVHHPPSVAGATGWNCYIGLESGNEQKQNDAPINFSTDYTVPFMGISLAGILPPLFPTNGYWAQGLITFTSGALNGVSAFVETSAGSGALGLRVPLDSIPATGVSFSIQVGCDKSMNKCQNFFGNLIHRSGVNFTPTPETGF